MADDFSYTVDGTGLVSGTLTLDSVAPGVHEVEIIGTSGTITKGKFAFVTGLEGRLRRSLSAAHNDLFGPINQTFEVTEQMDVASISVYISALGSAGDIVLQLREVDAGIPTQTVLGHSRIAFSSLATGWTEFAFTPVNLLPETEYCFVIYTENSDHALAVAELGQIDVDTNVAITKQSYRQGVLSTSANGKAWTPNQTKDLSFRINKAVYTSNTKTVALGVVAGTLVTDIMILGEYDRPSRDTKVQFKITDPNSNIYFVDRNEPVRLAAATTGDFTIEVILDGTADLSPVLFADSQVVLGVLSTADDYISKFIATDTTLDFTVKFEAKIESGAAVTVDVEEDDGIGGVQWTALTLDSSKTRTLSDGWQRLVYKATGLEGHDYGTIIGIRLRLNLTGTISGRPFIRRLSGIETASTP